MGKLWESVSIQSVNGLTMSLQCGWVFIPFWLLIQNMLMVSSTIICIWWPQCKHKMLTHVFVGERGQWLSLSLARLSTPSLTILSYLCCIRMLYSGPVKKLVGWWGSGGINWWVILNWRQGTSRNTGVYPCTSFYYLCQWYNRRNWVHPYQVCRWHKIGGTR